MDYIEKLFKQHPFIYCISGRYYALGSYICAECDMKSITLESRYRRYEESINEELTSLEAWKIFHRLIFKAETLRDEIGFCVDPQNEILKFHFSDDEMKELEMQIDRYLDYWHKYSLKDYV